MATTTTTTATTSSVQEMLRRFEATGLADRPRTTVSRRTASFRTAAPSYVKLRHRSSESRSGLQRSRPVSAHVSPLLRERPPVLKRNAALKARVSDRVREMERQKTAEGEGGQDSGGDDEKAAAPALCDSGELECGAKSSSVGDEEGSEKNHGCAVKGVLSGTGSRQVSRQPSRRQSATGVSPTGGGKRVWRRPQVTKHKPLVRSIGGENNNNAAKLSTSDTKAKLVAAKTPLSRVTASKGAADDLSSLPLPQGPPPPKPPRTFEHDAYVASRQPASLGLSSPVQPISLSAAAATDAATTTTVTIRRSGSGPRPAVARKPSDLGALRNRDHLQTFLPRSTSASARLPAVPASPASPAEHVYAEPTLGRPRDPPPPPPPPVTPPPPPPKQRRPSGGPTAPYAVSRPLRRSASDETLYGTLSREHVYERLPEAGRPASTSSSAGSPPGLRRHPAFKRPERPSLKRTGMIHPGPPPPVGRLAREAGHGMGCQMAVMATEDQKPEKENNRPGWRAGALAVRRRNYLRRVTTRMGSKRSFSAVSAEERLYDALLVVALSADADGKLEPCVLSKFPPDAELEADVAPFCFPDAGRWQRAPDQWGRSCADGGAAYTLVVTDERGGRRFGYCRRLTADTGDGEVTLPIAYCLLTRHHATAFYGRLLSAMMEHHGTSEPQRLAMLEDLRRQRFPAPGGCVTVLPVQPGAGPGELADNRRNGTLSQCFPLCRDVPVEVRRPLDARLDEDGLYQLVRRLGVDIFIQLFSSALLERKIVLYSSHLSVLSASVSALQAALSPFVWQHVLVPVVPSHLAEVMAAPSPLIMGALPETRPLDHLSQQEDAICVDLDAPSMVQSVGDEATILPRRLARALAEALRLAAWLPGAEPDPASAAVLLAETLLRLFVEVCGHYRCHLVTQQDGKALFQREAFVSAAPSDDVREFLSWFTETAMFDAFVQSCEKHTESADVSLFDRRVLERHSDLESSTQNLLKGTRQLGRAGAARCWWRLNT